MDGNWPHACPYRQGPARELTGKVLEVVDFMPGFCDPHGLAWHDGKFFGCDAGIHPGWANHDSPTAGWVFQIDIV